MLKYLALLLIFIPTNAWANVGLPMISVGLPFMLLLFLPVLLIEILIYKTKLNKQFWDATKVAGIANIYTTIIGYPISWFLLLIYQIIISFVASGVSGMLPPKYVNNQTLSFLAMPFMTPAWLYPFYNYPIDLIVCLAGMVGLIPAYLITVVSEQKVLSKFWGTEENIKSICVIANRASYLLLYVVVICLYFYTIIFKY